MKCWVCKRQARGFGHTDITHPVGNPRRYPLDWVFCSVRCQQAFHAMYGNWIRAKDGRMPVREGDMVDASVMEKQAMQTCLKAFGDAASGIGFGKPLGQYSKGEALMVIEAIVNCWTHAMVQGHEASRYPPVRVNGGGAALVTDPIPANPFSDMPSDEPWRDDGATPKEAAR